jgi:hypothetical protein
MLKCDECRRVLTADEPIYRPLGRRWHALYCDTCTGSPRYGERWRPPVRCGGCGHPVSLPVDRRPRLAVCCGREACVSAIQAAARRAQRRRPRARADCGVRVQADP